MGGAEIDEIDNLLTFGRLGGVVWGKAGQEVESHACLDGRPLFVVGGELGTALR